MFKPKTKEIEALARKFPERIKELEAILTDKTIVYIDFANVRRCVRRIGWDIDLRKLKDFLDSFGVLEARFYFGTIPGNGGSEKFMTFVHRAGYKVRTKPVKIMRLSIDVSSISSRSPDILANFVSKTLLNELRLEAIEYLNSELRTMNRAGKPYLEHPKCNFDVEIGTDMRLHHTLKQAETFCLWSGDSDFADPIKQILDQKGTVCLFGTSGQIASELNELRHAGLKIFEIKKLREFIQK